MVKVIKIHRLTEKRGEKAKVSKLIFYFEGLENSDKEITFDLRRGQSVPPVEINLHHKQIANDYTLFGICGMFIVIYSGECKK